MVPRGTLVRSGWCFGRWRPRCTPNPIRQPWSAAEARTYPRRRRLRIVVDEAASGARALVAARGRPGRIDGHLRRASERIADDVLATIVHDRTLDPFAADSV